MHRALNRNQRLILSEIKQSQNESITNLLKRISKEHKIPLSTLKLNARILRDLGLIDFGTNSDFRSAKLTEEGAEVLALISRDSLTGRTAGCNPADPGSNLGPGTESG